MKTPEKRISEIFPESPKGYILLENKLLIPEIPLEEFALWGYLLYSQKMANFISHDLIYHCEISEN